MVVLSGVATRSMGAAGPQVAVPELFIARIMPLGYFNTRVTVVSCAERGSPNR